MYHANGQFVMLLFIMNNIAKFLFRNTVHNTFSTTL